MRICILSDSHDNIPVLCAAVASAKAQGAEAVLHCGDVVAPSTLAKIQKFELPVHVIHGNNTGDLYALSRLSHKTDSLIHYYGQDASLELAGQRIFLVHYPHYAKAMAVTGDYDLVCCGHNHRAEIRSIETIKAGTCILCNPGTVGGIGAQATFVLADLENMHLDIQSLQAEGK
ncbi:metallophosphoesterase family protein [Candidatus Venteria ishoeyi]|uniref:Phosphoesterase n=1 Tax=Candidatus Venteria ishoeyi TaxID=1899563 RepID=A0A1H6FG08_9GAMM|nr:metallophosphoesterase family protein [Candidatus Venteria ishoeyi]MDM8546696.1 metallophosphoesterase family protein [Candidatus Venteria ishoeyi]SEH08583.1 phosphodiesterase [Candidatus Venteria ishoeyi]